MEEISVTEFKATCLRVIERVRSAGVSVLLVKNGKPAAVLSPPPNSTSTHIKAGALAGRAVVKGDLMNPTGDEEWEALR